MEVNPNLTEEAKLNKDLNRDKEVEVVNRDKVVAVVAVAINKIKGLVKDKAKVKEVVKEDPVKAMTTHFNQVKPHSSKRMLMDLTPTISHLNTEIRTAPLIKEDLDTVSSRKSVAVQVNNNRDPVDHKEDQITKITIMV